MRSRHRVFCFSTLLCEMVFVLFFVVMMLFHPECIPVEGVVYCHIYLSHYLLLFCIICHRLNPLSEASYFAFEFLW